MPNNEGTKIYPKSFSDIDVRNLPDEGREQPLSGLIQGVHFTMPPEQGASILEKVEAWFEDRDDVSLISHGATEKEEVGYIVLEFDEYEIDRLFLSILRHDPNIIDFTVYDVEVD